MTEQIVMPPVIDILKVFSYLNNRGQNRGSISCRMAVRIIDKVPKDKCTSIPEVPDVAWYRAGVLWMEFVKREELIGKYAKVRNINDRAAVSDYLAALPDTVIPLGVVTVAVSSKDDVLTNRDILVTGRLNVGVGQNILCMFQYTKEGEIFKAKPCGVTPLSIAAKTKEQNVLFNNLLLDGRMNVTIKTLGDNDLGIVRVGIDPFDPVTCGVLPMITYAKWRIDSTTLTRQSYELLTAKDTTLAVEMGSEIGDINGKVNSFVTEAKSSSQGVTNYLKVEVPQVSDTSKGVEVRRGRVFYNRKEFYENKPFIEALKKILAESEDKVAVKREELSDFDLTPELENKYLSLGGEPFEDDIDATFVYDYVVLETLKQMWDNFIKGVRQTSRTWKSKPTVVVGGMNISGTTGRMLLKRFFERAYQWGLLQPEESKKLSKDDKIAEEIDAYCSDINTPSCLMTKNGYSGSELQSKLGVSVKSKFISWLLLMLCVVLDIDYNFADYCDSSSDDYFSELLAWIGRNPYDLIFPLGDISLKDMDKLAMFMGVFCDERLQASRCVAYLHGVMTSESNKYVNSRTCVPLEGVKQWFTYGFNCSAVEERRKPSKDIAVNSTLYVDALTYLNLSGDNFKLKYTNVTTTTTGTLYVMGINTDEAIKNYCNSGYGVILNFDGLPTCLSDYSLLNIEYQIYRYSLDLYTVGKQMDADDVLSDTDIDNYIAKFEASKAKELGIAQFKLEDKQREAAHMVVSPLMALYGGAGTGKTTTAEVLLYILQEGYGISNDEILFIAPTGRAATRLREVVKRPTSTIHRALKLGIGKNKSACGSLMDYRVIIVDECSMITVNLMYCLLKAICSGTRVYFLGDIAQLLPIGFGKPFATMLRYLPCVTLEVSKRAKEGSKITECANDWLANDVETPIRDGDDLRCVPATQSNAGDLILDIVKHYLNNNFKLPIGVPEIGLSNLTPDDIQICTPIKNARGGASYNSRSLNISLRDMFNPFNGQTRLFWKVSSGVEEFRVGDRVIHTENNGNATRYTMQGDVYYRINPEDSSGVMNGDIGKIVDIRAYDEIDIYTEEGELLSHKRNDKYKIGLVVEYADVDLKTNMPMNYVIIYTLNADSDVEDAIGCHYATYASVANTSLELAYALTVHKLQGSQAALILFPFFSMGSDSDFMCNELVYTGMTRGRSGLYVIGDVSNPARLKQIQDSRVLGRRLSIFDLY